jgi:hypothetical protein
MTCSGLVVRVISGGQTGVDRAALDAAIALGIETGGWCPLGRLAEDGPIDRRYPLTETPTRDYDGRTLWNVRDSDGTLVLAWGEPTGGTAYTISCARQLRRPCLVVDLRARPEVASVREWIAQNQIGTLNVAGPRASHDPLVYETAHRFLLAALR